MTAAAFDVDEDGWPDILLACDSTPSLLLMNNHDGTFREEGLQRGVALNSEGKEWPEWAWASETTTWTATWTS